MKLFLALFIFSSVSFVEARTPAPGLDPNIEVQTENSGSWALGAPPVPGCRKCEDQKDLLLTHERENARNLDQFKNINGTGDSQGGRSGQ